MRAGFLVSAPVILGGLTLGFFLWYAIISHSALAVVSDELLVITEVAAVWGSIVACVAYSDYVARRSGCAAESVLRWDAWSWLALLSFWLGFNGHLGAIWAGRSIVLGLGLYCLAKVLAAARFHPTMRDVVTTFFVTRIPLLLIAELASVMIGQRAGEHVSLSSNPLLAVWGRWDAVHYVEVATRGYFDTDVAFFPLYPTLIALLGRLTGNHVFAGLLISNVAFFVGLVYLYKLVAKMYDREVAHRAIFYVSIFPTAIFFSAIYTEALFFALTVASYYFIRERKPITAGCIGLFASLTRVEGVLLIAPMAIEAIRLRKIRGLLPKSVIGAGLIALGLVVYMGYLWASVGDPMAFSHVQAHWNRKLAPPWTSVLHSFTMIAQATTPLTIANQGLELAFTAFMLVMLFVGVRTMRWALAAYTALSILVPMSTSSLMSMPRFALVLFPMFIVLAVWGRRPTINNAIVSFSLPLLGFFTVLFADWYWVA